MARVELGFTPLPAHVRTARLVATAVARRSGVEESLLDEVRLAVGEACSRAVEAHRLHCPAEPVRILLSDTGGRFEVVVTDAVPAAEVGLAAAHAPAEAHARAEGKATGTGLSPDQVRPAVPRGPAAVAPPAGDPRTWSPARGGSPAGITPAGDQLKAVDQAGDATTRTAAVSDGRMPGGEVGAGRSNGSLPADLGFAVIAGLADDVEISAADDGVRIRMSWPLAGRD